MFKLRLQAREPRAFFADANVLCVVIGSESLFDEESIALILDSTVYVWDDGLVPVERFYEFVLIHIEAFLLKLPHHCLVNPLQKLLNQTLVLCLS